MESTFEKHLTNEHRDDTQQNYVYCLLNALKDAVFTPPFKAIILAIIKDDQWRDNIRRLALDIFLDKYYDLTTSKQLLAAIIDGKLLDQTDSLLGRLLTELYPSEVTPTEIFNYLHSPKKPNLIGTYKHFWRNHLLTKLDDKQAKLLLEATLSHLDFVREITANSRHRFTGFGPAVLLKLLWRNLNAYGDETPTEIAFFIEAIHALQTQANNDQLTLEMLEKYAKQKPLLETYLQQELTCPIGYMPQRDAAMAKFEEEQKTWIEGLSQRLTNDTLALNDLYAMASIYWGQAYEAEGDTSIERLNNFFSHNKQLVELAIEALCNTLQYDDTPSVETIIELATSKQLHILSAPWLAALDYLTQMSPINDVVTKFTEAQIKLTIAFHLTWLGDKPPYYQQLLAIHPKLFADIIIQFSKRAWRKKKNSINFYDFAYNDSYATVAKLIALPLLKVFPTRGNDSQLNDLDLLLKTALRYCDNQELNDLIDIKLANSSMTQSQRVRWLSTGLFNAPDRYLKPLQSLIDNQQKLIVEMAEFLYERRQAPILPIEELSIQAQSTLVQMIGHIYAPYESPDEGNNIRDHMNAADFASKLISVLANRVAVDAANELNRLLGDHALSHWRTRLQEALYKQLYIRREATYTHPNIETLYEFFNNTQLGPTSAADLAAIVLEEIHYVRKKFTDGDTDAYKQCWNVDQHERPIHPKPEGSCRDALLALLQERLKPYGIDAHPEGHYTRDKRTDIRVCYPPYNLPIEIKRNYHNKVWAAIKDQLISQYTCDPNTTGYGIYLVFWFGLDTDPKMPLNPNTGTRPNTPEALKQLLEDSLTEEEAQKISVCVIDVSPEPNCPRTSLRVPPTG